jgi:hypothetical protein
MHHGEVQRRVRRGRILIAGIRSHSRAQCDCARLGTGLARCRSTCSRGTQALEARIADCAATDTVSVAGVLRVQDFDVLLARHGLQFFPRVACGHIAHSLESFAARVVGHDFIMTRGTDIGKVDGV